MRLNITLKIPAEMKEEIIQLSKDIAKKNKTDIILNNENCFPHITIYSPEFPEKNLEEIINKIREITVNSNKFKLKFKDISEGIGYLMLDWENTEDLQNLQRWVVEELNPLREGMLREKYKDEKFLNSLTNEERNNIKKYGHQRLFASYQPHLTVTKYSDENVRGFLGLSWNIKELEVNGLEIYEAGDNGTCVKLIRSFDFDKSDWGEIRNQFEKEIAKKLKQLPSHKNVKETDKELRNIISHELPETSPEEIYECLIDILLSEQNYEIAHIRKIYLNPELEKEKQILKSNRKKFEELRESVKVWILNNLPENQLLTDWKDHKTWLPRRYLIYKNPNLPFQEIAIDTLARFALIGGKVKLNML